MRKALAADTVFYQSDGTTSRCREHDDEVDFVLEAGQQTIIAKNGIPWQEFLKLDPMELFAFD